MRTRLFANDLARVPERMRARQAELLRFEQSFECDPAAWDCDFETLRQLLP